MKNGVLRLPPGFRFHPTDEELVVQYLKRKAFCCPLPASIIPEVDVCKSDPWDLPGWYLFNSENFNLYSANCSKASLEYGNAKLPTKGFIFIRWNSCR